MPSRCVESDNMIYAEGIFMIVSNSYQQKGHHISKKVVEDIPKKIRGKKPCAPGDGGVNVHYAVKAREVEAGIICSQGDFLYSLTKEDAQKYFPRYCKNVLGY